MKENLHTSPKSLKGSNPYEELNLTKSQKTSPPGRRERPAARGLRKGEGGEPQSDPPTTRKLSSGQPGTQPGEPPSPQSPNGGLFKRIPRTGGEREGRNLPLALFFEIGKDSPIPIPDQKGGRKEQLLQKDLRRKYGKES